MRCPTCGTDNPEKARFCLYCGSKLAAPCSRCGADVPPQAKFCPECGARRGEAFPVRPAAVPGLPPAQEPSEAAGSSRNASPLPRAPAPDQAGGERRVVTILFTDIAGSTAIARSLDPEEWREVVSGAHRRVTDAVTRYEGTIGQLLGDGVLAFFGAPVAHEDDPARAVRAAIDIQAAIAAYGRELRDSVGDLAMRIGIHTGEVVVGELGNAGHAEYLAVGDAVNLAARMEQNAPPGGIRITHDTWRHVREAFDLQPQPPLSVKGHAEPVRTYLVLHARSPAFRPAIRGVEGIEVRMVGRDAELNQLQSIFHAVVEDRTLQVVTVVGDAGVGKSRLLYEFERWLGANPAHPVAFRGRATAMAQGAPYGLLRDVFARRCTILESDSATVAREKLEQEITALLGTAGDGPLKAHFIGHLLGFDFSDSPHLRGALGDPRQLHERARAYLANFFRAAASRAPAVVLLEDLHWADDSSLDALNHLALALADCPLLLVGAARPLLYERRPHWGEGQSCHVRLGLAPLSLQASRRLVAEILQRVEVVPDALRDLVVTGAEGNPFFAEELIKMLIEDGVIVKGADGQEAWRVELDRLRTAHVPDTLSAVLQARLDRLTTSERSVLQQASVVGRQFWDQAVAQINRAEGHGEVVPAALATLRAKEMVFQRETSAFAGAQEYIFKHALLREVAYESLLKRLRRVYHGLVADWLIEQGGERAGEIAGQIGEHLELAGRAAQAADYLGRAAASAAAKYANEEAIGYYLRALALNRETAPSDRQPLAPLYEGLGDVYELLSRKSEARATYEGALAAIPEDDRICRARLQRKLANVLPTTQVDERLKELAVAEDELGPAAAETDSAWWHEWLEIQSTRMWSYYWDLRFEEIEQVAAQVRPVLETRGTLGQRSEFYRCLANAGMTRNRAVGTDESIAHLRIALACDREAGNLRKIALDQFMLGFHLLLHGDLRKAEPELQYGLELAEQVGDAWVQTIALTYLTIDYRLGNDIDLARAHAARSLETAAKAKLELYVAMARGNLAWLAWRDGDFTAAEALGQTALTFLKATTNPFHWVALWPLIAMAAAGEQFSDAIDLARQMLHPSQQRLPDALAALLEEAIRAAENDGPEAGRAELQQALALAGRMGYL